MSRSAQVCSVILYANNIKKGSKPPRVLPKKFEKKDKKSCQEIWRYPADFYIIGIMLPAFSSFSTVVVPLKKSEKSCQNVWRFQDFFVTLQSNRERERH